MKELDLGTGNIGSLIKRYSIPCVISMVVAALYNIVDQIFIGWSIWKCCNKHSISIYSTWHRSGHSLFCLPEGEGETPVNELYTNIEQGGKSNAAKA